MAIAGFDQGCWLLYTNVLIQLSHTCTMQGEERTVCVHAS